MPGAVVASPPAHAAAVTSVGIMVAAVKAKARRMRFIAIIPLAASARPSQDYSMRWRQAGNKRKFPYGGRVSSVGEADRAWKLARPRKLLNNQSN